MQEQVCKNCGNNFTGKFCNNCGEKVYHDKDKKVLHLFGEAFHFVTHFEGTFFTSLKTIISRPGKISVDFCRGVRKRYFKPMSFFLLLVVLYLLFPVFEGLNMRLYFHTKNELYGSFAQRKADAIMLAKNMSWDQLSDTFHQKGEKVSKFLLFIILPFMGIVSWLLGYRKRKYYYDHFIFATESTSFLILWGFLILPVILVALKGIFSADVMNGDTYTGPALLFGMLIHTLIASKRFFKFRLLFTFIYTILYLSVLVLFIQYIYKFLLFYLSIIQI